MLFDILGFILPFVSFLHGLAIGLGLEVLSYYVMGLYVLCISILYFHMKQQIAQKNNHQNDSSQQDPAGTDAS